MIDANTLIDQAMDAYKRTLLMVEGLNEDEMMGPKQATLNPLRWEIAHASYFYEFWILRGHFNIKPYTSNIDQLFDSISILHDDRWDLPLPTLEFTYEYMQYVHDNTIALLREHSEDTELLYLAQYSIFHEDMHCEAFAYERQTLSYPSPKIITQEYESSATDNVLSKDIEIPKGTFLFGAKPEDGFVFDNEKWAHEVEVQSFKIASTTVTNHEYLEFVLAGGYLNEQYWCKQGWQWRSKLDLQHPVYWRKTGANTIEWEVRHFDQWIALSASLPVMNVSWYEANAYCNWANRRLPTEIEWEAAASGRLNTEGELAINKQDYPWGDHLPTNHHANLDGYSLAPIDARALPASDTALGCRQMIGNVWEWTSSIFTPYPGFTPDMYVDYSQPLFSNTRVLRGGSWVTRARLIRNTYRNYYAPERNDIFAGFRTCAV